MFQQQEKSKQNNNRWIGLSVTDSAQYQRVAHNVALTLSKKAQNLSDPFFYRRWYNYFIRNIECPYDYMET